MSSIVPSAGSGLVGSGRSGVTVMDSCGKFIVSQQWSATADVVVVVVAGGECLLCCGMSTDAVVTNIILSHLSVPTLRCHKVVAVKT